MDFRSLEAFVAVVESRSFSEAAKKLEIAQPTITTRIQSLEEFLGFALLHRSTRSVELTPMGRNFLEDAQLLLEERERILHRYEGGRHRLVMGVSSLCARVLLPKLLGQLVEQFGDVPVRITRSNSQGTLDNLRHGRADIALIGTQVKEREFDAIPLCEDRFVAIFPKDRETDRLLLREKGSGTRQHLASYLKTLYPDAPTSVVGDTDLLISLVAEGAGFSVVSEGALNTHRNRLDVKVQPLDIPSRWLYLVVKKQRPPHPLVDAFLALCGLRCD